MFYPCIVPSKSNNIYMKYSLNYHIISDYIHKNLPYYTILYKSLAKYILC